MLPVGNTANIEVTLFNYISKAVGELPRVTSGGVDERCPICNLDYGVHVLPAIMKNNGRGGLRETLWNPWPTF